MRRGAVLSPIPRRRGASLNPAKPRKGHRRICHGSFLRDDRARVSVARTPFDVAGVPNAGSFMRLIYWPTWTPLDGLLAGIVAATIKTLRPGRWATLTALPNLFLAPGVVGVAVSMIFFHDQVSGFVPTVLAFPLLAFSMAMVVMAGSETRSLIGRYAVPGAGALATGAYSLYLSLSFRPCMPDYPTCRPRSRAWGLRLPCLLRLGSARRCSGWWSDRSCSSGTGSKVHPAVLWPPLWPRRSLRSSVNRSVRFNSH